MPRPPLSRLIVPGLLALVSGSSLACGDPLAGTATQPNFVDTLTLYALRNTSIRLPSAFSLLDLVPVRTDTTPAFDFAVDLPTDSTVRIYPTGVLNLPSGPGLQILDRTFDDVRSAPLDGYITDDSVTVGTHQVFVVRSRSTVRSGFEACLFFAAVPRYGKFRILAIDPIERSIVLESLVNLNCGFRGLEPGIPSS